MPGGELGVRGDDSKLLLPGERTLPLHIPAVIERTLVPVGPLLGDVMRGMRCARREIDKERLLRHQRLLLTHPGDGPIGQILGQVITLFRGRRRLHRCRTVIQRRIPLIVLPANEPVERLEPTTTRGPRVKRAHRRRLPHRHLMALTELRGRIPVQLQSHRQRRLRVRPQRAIARSRRRRLGNTAHPHRMMITARQQRSPRRRTQRCGVETVVHQTTRRQPVRRRRTTRTTKRARRAETDIIQQDDQNVRRTLRRQQWLDRREGSVWILRVISRQTRRWPVRDGQHRACMSVGTHGFLQNRLFRKAQRRSARGPVGPDRFQSR